MRQPLANLRSLFSRVTGFVAILLLGGILAACSKEPIKLGFVDGLSGNRADLGISSRDGAMLAVSKRNASGGIQGHSIQLIIKDAEYGQEAAQRAVKELLAEGVVAIIGPGTSNTAVATAPLADAAKTVMISHTVTSKELSGKYEYFFRIVNTTDKYATKIALFRRNVLKEKRVAIIYDSDNLAYTQSWMEDFRKVYEEAGGTVSVAIKFKSSASPSMGQLAQQLLASSPDGILIISNSQDAAAICREIRKLNRTVNLGTSEWAATEQLVDFGGKSVEGIYSSQFIDRNSRKPEYVEFRKQYLNRFGKEPGFGGVNAYDATNVLLDALEKNGDKETLGKTILTIGTFNGVQGAIRFKPYGEAERSSFITTIIGGRFQTYEN